MTMLAVIIIGAGALLTVSALENQSIAQTFQELMSGTLPALPKVQASTGASGGGMSGAQ